MSAAVVLAAAATVAVSAFGGSATACAAPKPWDQAAYDACYTQAYDDWRAGKISTQTYHADL